MHKTHQHTHGHSPHPAATVSASILRLSGPARLAAVSGALVLLWAAVFWVLA